MRHVREALPKLARRIAAAAVVLGALAGASARAGEPDSIALGREKYVQCASCHGADGRSTVVPQYPKIGGQSATYVILALKAYRDGRRQGTFAAIMAAVAKQLSDADIEHLAAYVESLGGDK